MQQDEPVDYGQHDAEHRHSDSGRRQSNHGQRVAQNDRARHFRLPSSSPSSSSSSSGRRELPADASALTRLGFGAWDLVKELATILLIAVVISFLIKTFLFRAFYIPSGSMENTLRIDDRIFVNLLVPEPMSLKRGDVVVFKDTQGWLAGQPQKAPGAFSWLENAATFIGLAPDNSQQHLVKRVIGLPGDTVSCCSADGKIMINGTAITEPYIYAGAVPSLTTFNVTVPAGHIWVMGDHRDDSDDSREHESRNGTGMVPIADIDGRAVVVAWPVSHWTYLGNYGDVFSKVPEPLKSVSQGSVQGVPAGK